MDQEGPLSKTIADRYVIERELGSGGMATVYLAEDLRHHRKVAVKILSPDSAEAVGADRFLREIATAARLTHPHILPLFDSGETDGLLYFVMPFIGGGCLQSRLGREIQLPLEEAVRITRQIADALAFAHARGIIHRDIKPGNILLEAGHAFLTDFGVAQAVSGIDARKLTKSGTAVGTTTYMSPEQASGQASLDGRSDQYSLACVLYEMLAGRPPFRGPLEESVARQHLTADPVPVAQVRPSVPPQVTDAIARALSKTPADRFQTIGDFGRALGRRAEPGWGAVPPKLVRKNPGIGRAAALFLRWASKPLGASLLATGVVAAIVLMVKLLGGPQSTPLSALAEHVFQDSIAILPFEAEGGDEESQNLASRVTDQIARRLRRSGVIKVIDLFSVKSYLALGLTTRQIVDSLKVDKLISGTLFPAADHPEGRVVLEILEIPRAGDYRSFPSIEVSPGTAAETAARLADAFIDDLLAEYPDPDFASVEAPTQEGPGYESYVLGTSSLGRRTAGEMTRARGLFQQAISQDPGNAYAFSGLSKYYVLADVYRYRTDVEGYQTMGMAYAFAKRAIELEPNLADGYTARSLMAQRSYAPLSEVTADCQRAMELEPGGAENLAWCAQTLRLQGEDDSGLRAAEQAISMDPQNAGRRMSLAYIALALGDYETAEREARLAWQLEPEMMAPRAVEAWALLLAGDPAGCASRELGPHAVLRATCLQEMGMLEEAAAIVDSVEAGLRTGAFRHETFTEAVRTGDLAVYYGWNGNRSESLRWVRDSFELSPSGVDERVLGSALFDPVRGGSDFNDEVDRIQSQIWERVQAEGNRAYRERLGGRNTP